jgi:hypothetical protein
MPVSAPRRHFKMDVRRAGFLNRKPARLHPQPWAARVRGFALRPRPWPFALGEKFLPPRFRPQFLLSAPNFCFSPHWSSALRPSPLVPRFRFPHLLLALRPSQGKHILTKIIQLL